MSADLKIDQACPHFVSDEALFTGGDRRTVRPLRPIASAASVRVFLNHALEVPSEGVYLPAKVLGTRRGPFTLPSGLALELSVNQGQAQRVALPQVTKMAAPQLAGHLTKRLDGAKFSVINDFLLLTSREAGPGSSIRINAIDELVSGSVVRNRGAEALGFVAPREYRGLQNTPGWTLVTDPTTLADRPTRLILFDEPLKSASDFVEIGYNTVREECRRCGGVGIECDWRYDVNGNPVFVRDEDLLLQELQKNLFTLIGSNPFHTWYGSSLMQQVGRKLSASGLTQNLIAADIQQSFSRWQSIKRQQEDAMYVSDREYPYQLMNVSVQSSSSDPTVILVDVTVQNRSNQPIQLSRGFRTQPSYELPASSTRPSLSNYTLVG